jgi:zinc protease
MSVDRSRLPGLGPEPPFQFPDIRRHTLSNGLSAWTAEHDQVPLITVLALIPSGAAADPADRPGLTALTGDLLDEGSGDLDALGFHDALGRIGAQLETEVGADATLLGVTSLTRVADRAFALLAGAVTRPRFGQSDFERVRDLRLNRLVQLRDLPPAVAERAFLETLYRAHPYGHLPIGTESSLRSVTLDEVRDLHAAAYQPSRATVIAVGDSSHADLASRLEAAFGDWDGDGAAMPAEVHERHVSPPPERLVLVHRPGAAQSEMRIGHVSVPRSTPDYHALLVMNMVLGGQFVSRINMNLREQKGYTYGARTSFDFRRGPGPFLLQASVQSEATADAVREALTELRAIRGDRPVTREELELGRAALTRGYPRSFETGEQIARGAAQLSLYGLPDDYFSTFVPKVLALGEADVTRTAARHIDPERLVTVVVGDRDKVGPSLEALGLGTPVETVLAT